MLNRYIILIISTACLALSYVSGVVPFLSNKALDSLFLLRGPVKPSQKILIINVDEDTLNALGAWPFQRKYHAKLLGRLSKAKVIGFDILFSEPTDQDTLFGTAIKSSPPVVLAAIQNYQNLILYPSLFLTGYFGAGQVETILSRDGIVRKIKPFQNSGRRGDPAFSVVMLKAAGIEPAPALLDKQILINHYGPKNTFLYLSYIDVLQGRIPVDFFNNRFILIGVTAMGIGDYHSTPFSRQYQIPGVEIQATVLNNLLENSQLHPLPFLSWLLAAGIALLSLFVWPTRAEKWNLAINLSLAVLLSLGSLFLFHRFLFLDPAPALFFLGLTFFVHLVTERLWTAKVISREMIRLDRQLEMQLRHLYTNVPSQFFNLQPIPSNGGIRHHLLHLETGVKILSLQHHFIENLLKEELPPLILWDRHSGQVIIANTMFNVFWDQHAPEETDLPELDSFIDLMKKKLPSGNKFCITIGSLLKDNNTPAIDIDLSKNGEKKYFRINIHPFDVEDIDFKGVLAVVTDVTEIKELEQLKDEIVSIVSHELKLPLTVILGYGEMLSATLQGSEKGYIDKICSQANRQNSLIENFLDVVRLEHGHQEIKLLPLDLSRLVKEAVNTVSIPAMKKNIEIVHKIPYRTTPVCGDYTLLLQATTNLLDNAIKFSPANTEVTIGLTEKPDHFVLYVTDQGPGIPSGSRKEIFHKFNRGRQNTGVSGFGLGLNFVQQVVQKHGGRLWLKPEESSGATFCIELAKNSKT